MITLQPQGTKLIVKPIETNNFKTESGIELVQLELQEGEVKEVSAELSEIYSKGDTVIFPKGSGLSIMYQKESCVFLNGGGGANDIYAIVTKDDNE